MSLNNEQMLPARVRNMRQMGELLDAEDIILAEIEKIIEEIYQRVSLLQEELINEDWLEKQLSEKIEKSVTVISHADKELLVDFILEMNGISSINIWEIRKFIEKWLPAHLMYHIILQHKNRTKVCVGSAKEVFVRKEIGIHSSNKPLYKKAGVMVASRTLHHVIVSYQKGN